MPSDLTPNNPAPISTTDAAPPLADRALEMSIMYTISSVVIVVISGFAVYRWQTDDTTGAAINTLIVSMVLCTLMLARKPAYAGLSLKLFGLTSCAAALLSSFFVSNNGLLWALLVLLVNALTLSRVLALILNAIVIIGLTAANHLYENVLQHVSWTTVAILITGFSHLFMDQLRQQRTLLAAQANVDPLTGAGNRRLMKQHLQELASGRRSGELTATLMVFDLDKFKDVNDEHGHETGDRVLVEFVNSAHASMRVEDGFYRMGGEEFVMLLRGMDEATARTYLPGLQQRLSGQVSTPSGTVEFSAGAAAMRKGETWSQWLARADKALYSAKGTGRNRLTFCEE